ncbi:hypothetical protein PI125_g12694 [Phytophthora idaei]|nr:hypothetical protein PI125_g12694 [Phytophthora idaei]
MPSDGTMTGGSGSSDSSSVSVGVIAGIAIGCIVLLLLAVGFCCWRRRGRNKKQVGMDIPSPVVFEQVATPKQLPGSSVKRTTEMKTLSSSGGTVVSKPWDDEAMRGIPREKVQCWPYVYE